MLSQVPTEIVTSLLHVTTRTTQDGKVTCAPAKYVLLLLLFRTSFDENGPREPRGHAWTKRWRSLFEEEGERLQRHLDNRFAAAMQGRIAHALNEGDWSTPVRIRALWSELIRELRKDGRWQAPALGVSWRVSSDRWLLTAYDEGGNLLASVNDIVRALDANARRVPARRAAIDLIAHGSETTYDPRRGELVILGRTRLSSLEEKVDRLLGGRLRRLSVVSVDHSLADIVDCLHRPVAAELRGLEIIGHGHLDISLADQLSRCTHLSGVSDLSLGGIHLSSDACRALLSGPALRRLRFIRLSSAGLTTEAFRSVLQVGVRERLRMLFLQDNSLDDGVFEEVARFGLPVLSTLDLSRNLLACNLARMICGDRCVPTLGYLDLRQNPISVDGIHSLVEVARCKATWIRFSSRDGALNGTVEDCPWHELSRGGQGVCWSHIDPNNIDDMLGAEGSGAPRGTDLTLGTRA